MGVSEPVGAGSAVDSPAVRARALFPLLRARARQLDDERHLTAEVVDALTDAGLVRTLVPTRWSGAGLTLLDALDATIEVARASGSAGWVQSFWSDHPHWVALFPDEAQQDVWAGGPDARVATSFMPVGRVEPEDGGWLLSGRWTWASGVSHSDWVMLGGLVISPDGPPDNRLFLVPIGEVTVLDTWYSAGLRGSGSDDVVAERVFVPEHRTLRMLTAREGTSPGAHLHPTPALTAPMMTHAGYAMVGPAIGVARGALEAWQEHARTKAHSHTHQQVSEALPMQLQLAESAVLIDTAEMLVRRCLSVVESGEPLGIEHRVRHRRDISFAMRLVTRAVDGLMQMAGASALRETSPIQRGWRDVRAISTHIMLNFNAAGENYGRLGLGLPLNPKDPFF